MEPTYNTNKDYEVPHPPSDSISSICWNMNPPNSVANIDILASGSWNNEVRIWEVRRNGERFEAAPKMAYSHSAPVLCVTQNYDGKVFSAGCDNTAKFVQLGANPSGSNPPQTQIAQHNAPIKTIDYIELQNCIMTGSWDKTIRYWDLRSPKQIAEVKMPERVYATSVFKRFAVIATAERKVVVIDLQNPTAIVKEMDSPLRFQTRCVSCFPDNQGFAIGSIEGRVGIQYFQEDSVSGKKNFAFKCHRENADIYAVNSIAFHPTHGTFATSGSDGTHHFWDKDSKQRLAQFKKVDAQIVSTAFNRDGNAFAYAVSYDWSKGYEFYNKNYGSHIMIKYPQEKDIKRKKK